MGAPKQKWTPEEEAALKAGVLRHGQGKWRTILKNPEFGGVLHLRSNVDLKDKWRNMTALANGLGSTEKARLGLKRMHQTPKQDESPMTLVSVAQSDEDTGEAEPVATSSDSPRIGGSRKSIIRLDNVIMDAINNLKEPGSSNKAAISAYIEDQYWAPPNFRGIVSAKLKYLTATGTPKRDCDEIYMLTKSQIESELAKMWSMTPKEAAAVAAQAVAEAEAAIAEAEEAAREAEEAEAAQAFAEAVMKTSTFSKHS